MLSSFMYTTKNKYDVSVSTNNDKTNATYEIIDARTMKNCKRGTVFGTVEIKALIALVDRLFLSVGWENGPEQKTVSFNP